jgi:hypothetical protein
MPGGRQAARVALSLSLLLLAPARSGEDSPLPPGVQAHLLAKAAAYDRNFAVRAAGEVRILIIGRPGTPAVAQASGRLRQALSEEQTVAGLPHREFLVDFVSAEQLKQRIHAEHSTVVYFSTGFSEREISELAQSLNGVDVLTVAASPQDVLHGAVLGFDLVSGHPKLLVNLTQARRQNVDFASDYLNLAQVVE